VTIDGDVRIVCATNALCRMKLKQGPFREDLFFASTFPRSAAAAPRAEGRPTR